jgi:hypothetical protein
MANLPAVRVTAGEPPFTYTGVDFFGPFIIKRGRSEIKRYGCLFTCLRVRAVHIEIVYTLETDSFINALQRFMSRRGQVKEIYSDNGTNFVGAKRELNQTKIDNFLKQRFIQWHFNPPAASHMGGVWERVIRSIRRILTAVLTLQKIDEEGLSTLFCIVESVLNGRPLTVVSDDCKDLQPLTPNHLLMLQGDVQLTAGEFIKTDLYCRRRWRQVQYLADIFWQRWLREYLPTLQLRQKWLKPTRNLSVGDIVIVANNNTSRQSWPLGRVVEVYKGQDGLVRSAKVAMKAGEFVRPVNKLCLLEAVEDD